MTKASFLSNHLILLIPFPVVLEDHCPLMETVHRHVKCVFRHFELMLENAILTNTRTCTCWVVSVHGWLPYIFRDASDFLVHLRKSQVISGQHGIILTPKVINIAQCFSLWKNFAAETSPVHCFGWTTPPFLRVMSFCSRLPSTPFPFMPPIVPCF